MAIYLPDSISREVLSRLPVKSLLRFRSVSKSWLSLISCPDFAKLQFKRASSVCKIMDLGRSNTLKWLSLDGLPKSQKFQLPFYNGSSRGRILGSVNGLLCICSSEYDSFRIYNPYTNQYKYIPALTYPHQLQVHYYGFGYDSTTDDYKLLIVTFPQRHSEIPGGAMISLFSLRRGSWRSFLDTKYLHQCIYGDRSGICLNDAIHWSFIQKSDSVTRPLIVCFGLAEESFSIIHVPDLYQKGVRLSVWDRCHLSVWDGRLCLSIKPRSPSDVSLHTLTIWVMKEYGVNSSWTELMSTEYSHSVYHFIRPLCFIGEGEGEILYQYDRCNLASFNTQTKTFTIHRGCYNLYGVYPIVHVETLIWPNASNSA